MAAGKVWLVGAGPGDIGLFTLKMQQNMYELPRDWSVHQKC